MVLLADSHAARTDARSRERNRNREALDFIFPFDAWEMGGESANQERFHGYISETSCLTTSRDVKSMAVESVCGTIRWLVVNCCYDRRDTFPHTFKVG